mmetsp:Transcript_58341/g.126132  ORF Transcript_58341/g.126132 Transcript_58341/m.126132 type:complete len:1494 (-) Transcript_58341:36-4517(-)|eukprot:CAMPEP_0170576958 /NCGR_PEP_ID=MMETSP0224-20130122/4669_1 /TAXON_ID=285029 /ORGANISM="Togula jolla, Strain CCCM 725" /LENGTH=1493 /DNA_ID=CAMNT_0010899833 /DNA_START=80 /DNA_END=4561 /DNA_ORIENTATION=-
MAAFAVKQIVQERNHGCYQIDAVNFSTLSSDEMARYGEIEVLNPQSHDSSTQKALPLGVMDGRMGICKRDVICDTCGNNLEDCIGHFGHVRLTMPVFHPGYLKHTYEAMQCICKACSRLLLSPDDRARFFASLRRPGSDDLRRAMIHKRLVTLCKRTRECFYCRATIRTMKKGLGLPLVFRHQLGLSKGPNDDAVKLHEDSFRDAIENNREVQAHIDKAQEDVNPLRAYDLLRQMTAQDRELMGMLHPEQLLLTSVPVPPVCIRPTVMMGDAGLSNDDLTFAISEIVTANQALRSHMDKGGQTRNQMEAWKFLQDKCATYINSEMSGLDLPKGRPIRSLCTRLKGKEGRFRGNLSGKRVDFSGRTVISPDPNVSVEEVVVPEWVARRMTYPERVCGANLKRLQEAIRRGPDEHPGANFVRSADGRGKYLGALRKNFRLQLADKLRCGDVVERHMRDGDIVLFNRQPSLHRLSIMAHRAKVMHDKGRTLRFNECVCAPYNADFDGDEMNIHLPQTEEARAEAIHLMGVRDGLVTPKSGEVMICATQDFLTASFLLTQKNVFLTRDKFCQICCYITDGLEQIELPPPAIMKPVELWTGKQAFNVMLRPNRKTNVIVNLEVPEKNYSKQGESMCPNDGWVIFRNSELLSGNLGKKILGGAKNGLFFRLIRDNSSQAAVGCMSRLAKMTSRWLMNRGFTIGIDDVTAHKAVREEKESITRDKYAIVDTLIQKYFAGTLSLKPGCNAEQTLEALVNGELSRIRDAVGNMCEEKLGFMNKPRIMAQCGSKGSAINLCQMMACVGQQNVGGQRIKDGFVQRTLPHFLKGSKEPKARGFVANSFYSGLEAPEFFFHTMGGREGLVDTAVKTAETGYMQRRLIKALEDLSLKYDLSVRTSSGEVVQFAFGDDGLNPARMEGSASSPLDLNYVLKHVQHTLRLPRPRPVGQADDSVSAEPSDGKRRRVEQPTVAGPGESLDLLPLPPFSAQGNAPVQRTAAQARHIGYRARLLLPTELRELAEPLADRFCAWVSRTHGCAELDLSHMRSEIATYIQGLSKDVARKRTQLGFVPGDTPESAQEARSKATVEQDLAVADMGLCPTQQHLETFVNRCALKYVQAMLMPGEAVGAVAAQSIGEPATQMTLKTFHFAGVASMNVTLGVPRIKEIINAAKVISTPIITCTLNDEYSEISARIVKGRIERTTLGDLCKYMKEVYEPCLGCFISVKVDLHTIQKLQLELTIADIKAALLEPKNLGSIRLQDADVEVVGADKLRVRPRRPASSANSRLMYFALQDLKNALPRVVVKGLRSTTRAVINKDDKEAKVRYNILVEGYGLQHVMATPGINPNKTKSNHVIEVEKVLGIEAARRTIMQEIAMTMGGHGIAVDARHVQMLGDCMTYRGAVLGINRYGISRMRTSTMMLASFERTNDHLFDAAAHQRRDPVTGVSECIILGSTVRLGTGLFKLLYDFGGRQPPAEPRATLLSGWRERVAAQKRPPPVEP